MPENKTKQTTVSVNSFLNTVSAERQKEAHKLIKIMQTISGKPPVMWGPSIIGFGTIHYRYDTGREGDMHKLAFSPRKASITIYFSEGFDRYSEHLASLGKHSHSVSCLYINKLSDININVLSTMLKISYDLTGEVLNKPKNVAEYCAQVPTAARQTFNELRAIARAALPDAEEVLSYGIVGYSIDGKRPRAYISGWKDHVAIYPIPNDETIRSKLKPYSKGKGSLWFKLDTPLPKELLIETLQAL